VTLLREYLLRFVVSTRKSGSVEMRYFRNPQDCGETISLNARERDDLILALSNPGFHSVLRDDQADQPDLQLKLPLALEEAA
jgi:hypothetical protein